jgi:hypothetical protein
MVLVLVLAHRIGLLVHRLCKLTSYYRRHLVCTCICVATPMKLLLFLGVFDYFHDTASYILHEWTWQSGYIISLIKKGIILISYMVNIRICYEDIWLPM